MKKFISILVIFSTLCSTAMSCSFAAETKAQPKTAITQQSKFDKVKKAGAAALAATVAVAAAYGIKSAVSKNEVVEQEHWYNKVLNWAKDNKSLIITETVNAGLFVLVYLFGRRGPRGLRGEPGERGPQGRTFEIPANVLYREDLVDCIKDHKDEINDILNPI